MPNCEASVVTINSLSQLGCSRIGALETNDKASSGEAHAQLLIQKLY